MYCKIKQVGIKLVIVYAYTNMHGQQNIKNCPLSFYNDCQDEN